MSILKNKIENFLYTTFYPFDSSPINNLTEFDELNINWDKVITFAKNGVSNPCTVCGKKGAQFEFSFYKQNLLNSSAISTGERVCSFDCIRKISSPQIKKLNASKYPDINTRIGTFLGVRLTTKEKKKLTPALLQSCFEGVCLKKKKSISCANCKADAQKLYLFYMFRCNERTWKGRQVYFCSKKCALTHFKNKILNQKDYA
ncbi:MAG: hypothetical protein Q7R76_01100 [Candidatus Woesearchaeota archaeon]|nr:hypothetical protein [Candidatus Woesearchaeota archaeon]